MGNDQKKVTTEEEKEKMREEKVGEKKMEEETVEEEEEQVFEYNYEEMKSTPVMANLTTNQMLTLQYP